MQKYSAFLDLFHAFPPPSCLTWFGNLENEVLRKGQKPFHADLAVKFLSLDIGNIVSFLWAALFFGEKILKIGIVKFFCKQTVENTLLEFLLQMWTVLELWKSQLFLLSLFLLYLFVWCNLFNRWLLLMSHVRNDWNKQHSPCCLFLKSLCDSQLRTRKFFYPHWNCSILYSENHLFSSIQVLKCCFIIPFRLQRLQVVEGGLVPLLII